MVAVASRSGRVRVRRRTCLSKLQPTQLLLKRVDITAKGSHRTTQLPNVRAKTIEGYAPYRRRMRVSACRHSPILRCRRCGWQTTTLGRPSCCGTMLPCTACVLATFRHVAPLLRAGGIYLVEDNEEHFATLRGSGIAWAYTALKSGATADELGTRGSSHHTLLSAFRRPPAASAANEAPAAAATAWCASAGCTQSQIR